MRSLRRFAAAVVIAGALTFAPSLAQEPTPVAAPSVEATPSALDIVAKAFERLGTYGEPPYVVYISRQAIEQEDSMGRNPRTFDVLNRIAYQSDSETFNIVNYPTQSAGLPDALIYAPPLVGPLARPVHAAALIRASSPSDDLNSTLKTIVTVVAHGKSHYNAHLVGIETAEHHRTSHVQLDPVGDAGRFSLRDIWVDVGTYDLRKAHYVVTNYSPSIITFASERDDITVYFVGAGPYWIAASWEDHGLNTSGPTHIVTQNSTVTVPASLPDWLFDRKAYADRERANDPDFLAHIFDHATPSP